MRVFGYLEATKHGQHGVLDGLQGPRHLVLTREANHAPKYTGFSHTVERAD